MERKLESTTKSLESTLSHTKALATSLNSLQDKYSKKSAALKQSQQEKLKISRQLSDQTYQLQDLHREISDLTAKNDMLVSALSEAAGNMDNLESVLHSKTELIAELEIELKSLRNAQGEWQREKSANVRQDKDRQAALEEFLDEQKALLAEVDANERDKQALKSRLQDERSAKDRALHELATFQTELETVRLDHARAEQRAEAQLDDLRRAVEESEAKRVEDVGRIAELWRLDKSDKQLVERYLEKIGEVVKDLEDRLEIANAEKSVLENKANDKEQICLLLESSNTENKFLHDRITVKLDHKDLEKELIKLNYENQKANEKSNNLTDISESLLKYLERVISIYKRIILT